MNTDGAADSSSFWALFGSTVLSNLSDGIVRLVLPLLAAELTRSPTLVALTSAFAQAPWLLLVLLAGAIVDRSDRRRLMLVATWTRVVMLAAFSWLLVAGVVSLPLLYVFAFGVGMLETLNDTSKQTIVPMVVGRRDLNRANGRLHAAELVTNEFVGPPLGGVLAGAGLAAALVTGSVAYAFAGLALLALPGSYRASSVVPRQRLLQEAAAGMRILWRDVTLRRLALVDGLSQLAFGAWMSVFVLYAVAPGPMGLSELGYGLLFSATAAGSVIASLAAAPVARRLGRRAVLTLAMVGWAVFLAAPVVTTDPWVVAGLLALGATGGTMFSIVGLSMRQLLAEDHTLGRVNAAHRTFAWGALPLGALLAGPIAEAAGLRILFAMTAFGTLLLALWTWVAFSTPKTSPATR